MTKTAIAPTTPRFHTLKRFIASLKLVVLLLAVLLWGNISGPAQAQTSGPLILVHTVAAESANFPNTAVPGLKLTVTFSLLETDGSIIRTKIKEGEAKLRLGDLVYPGNFGLLPPDWSVVVLVDTSATLGNARATNDFRTTRDSLSRSLQNMPDNTNVALVTFGDRAPTVQELIKDREGLSKKIAGLQASPRGSSCLNDGLYEAVNKLTGLQGRKAVFVFTASADNCSTRPLSQVIEAAHQSDVQLYAIGLEGYAVAQTDLDAFTQPTGGLGLMSSLSRLGLTLDNLVALLSNQWQAVWTLCPPQGPQTGTLNLVLEDTQTLTTPLAFTSDRAYACPPRVEVLGLEATTRTSVTFNINVSNREAVSRLDTQIVNKDTGRVVVTQNLTEISDVLALPATELQSGVDYLLTVTALNANNQLLYTTNEPFPFRYEPVTPEIKITTVDAPTLDHADFVITTTVKNPAQFDLQYYKAWLVTEQDNTLVKGTETTVPVGQPIVIPGGEIQSGNYLILAQALDSAQQPQAEAQPFKITYQRPSALERLIFQLRQYQGAVTGLAIAGGVSLLGLVALVWFLMPRRGGRVKAVELALPEKARHTAPEQPSAPIPTAKPKPPLKAQRPASAQSEAPRPSPKPVVAPPAQQPATPQAEASKPQPRPPAPTSPSSERTLLALPRATLKAIEPATLTFSAAITKTPLTVGRREGNDAVIPVDGASGVSGHHLTLSFANGLWYVQDDNSTYGTTLNGQPIPKAQRVPVDDGAVLGLGPVVKVQFHITRR